MTHNNFPFFFDYSDRMTKVVHEFLFNHPESEKPNYTLQFKGIRENLSDSMKIIYSGKEGVYDFKLRSDLLSTANGLNISFKLENWDEIKYIAIGFSTNEKFEHIKLFNFKRENWIDFSVSTNDLMWKIAQNSQLNGVDIKDIRVFIKGIPNVNGSFLYIKGMSAFYDSGEIGDSIEPTCSEMENILYTFYEWYFKTPEQQAESFMTQGLCPLTGGVELVWGIQDPVPNIFDVNTNQFSWHALHSSLILMLRSHNIDDIAALFSAREIANEWMNDNYFNFNASNKYIWYDHGTAERVIVFILLYLNGVKYKFDTRFMTKIYHAIMMHSRLLASEAFYSINQRTRYHNHAWFQDIALMITALVFQNAGSSKKWFNIAIDRLKDQFENSFIEEEQHSILIENSLGYHKGTENLTKLISDLLECYNIESDLTEKYHKIKSFTDLYMYPNGRLPSHGDTYRYSGMNSEKCKNKKVKNRVFFCSSKAGYASVQSNIYDTGMILNIFASSVVKTHKHQDHLSFTLFFDGIEWFVDPSFYSHEYNSPISSHLRSVWGHNNIAIKDLEYSIAPGLACINGTSDEDNFSIEGKHLAYQELEIKRKINGSYRELQLTIEDEIITSRTDLEVFNVLHLGEGVEVEEKGELVHLSHPNSKYILCIDYDGLKSQVIQGFQEERIFQGIIGHGFMEMIDSKCLVARINVFNKSNMHIYIFNHDGKGA